MVQKWSQYFKSKSLRDWIELLVRSVLNGMNVVCISKSPWCQLMAICMAYNRTVFFYLLCWIWFSWNVHRIDMRHWLLILTMMSLLCLILTSIDFVIFFFSRCCFYLSLYFLETLSLKLTIPHSHHSAHFEIKVNKVSFLLPFLTTAINNSFISILYWLVHCVGLHQFNFNVNYE